MKFLDVTRGMADCTWKQAEHAWLSRRNRSVLQQTKGGREELRRFDGDVGEARPAPILMDGRKDRVTGEVGAIKISTGSVNFVYRNYAWNTRGFGVVARLKRLRHNTVVCGDNQDSDISYLRTIGSHLSERSVARRIDERELMTIFDNLICTDALRNTTCFAGDYIGSDEGIQ